MRRMVAALSFAFSWIVILAGGLTAQAVLSPDLVSPNQLMNGTIPPFDPPDGTIITVTTFADELNDNGNCSLREAIEAANTCPITCDSDPGITAKEIRPVTAKWIQ